MSNILLASIILILIVLTASISRNLNIPLILIALGLGIFFGSDVTGIIYFDDAALAQKLANFALIFILFAGGFGTKSYNLKPVIRPTLFLATVGVVLTALITGVLFYFVSGWPFLKSMLLATIISSTDAAAVFSILRTRSISKNVSAITEIESAANDPMAIISTTLVLQLVIGAEFNTFTSIFLFTWQLAGGVAFGLLTGILAVYLFRKIKDIDIGYFYLLLIGVILLSYSLADLCRASGMLSAFFSGFIMGNRKLPFKTGISSFSETLAFISNVGLFLLLGLLVFPRKFANIWELGILLFLMITLVGRPVTVILAGFLMKLSIREKIFLSWSGIRGAVPIVLATYPAAVGIDQEHEIFNIVFVSVTISILVQGSMIGKVADWLRLSFKARKKSRQTMELVTIHDTDYELIEVHIDEDLYEGICKISEINMPVGTTITMINRNNSIIAPSGKTLIYPGDVISILVERTKQEEATLAIISRFNLKS